jgi:hypothetical protein
VLGRSLQGQGELQRKGSGRGVGRSVVRGGVSAVRRSSQMHGSRHRQASGTKSTQRHRETDRELGVGKDRDFVTVAGGGGSCPAHPSACSSAAPANRHSARARASRSLLSLPLLRRREGGRIAGRGRVVAASARPCAFANLSRRRGGRLHQQPPRPPRPGGPRHQVGLADMRTRLPGLARSPSARSLNAPRGDWPRHAAGPRASWAASSTRPAESCAARIAVLWCRRGRCGALILSHAWIGLAVRSASASEIGSSAQLLAVAAN